MKINKSRPGGFTLVEIMIVVAIIGLLAAIAIPNFVKARTQTQKNLCIANLRQISMAKPIWCFEKKKNPSDTPVDADIFGINGYIRDKPDCPANGIYDIMPVDTKATCTIEGHSF